MFRFISIFILFGRGPNYGYRGKILAIKDNGSRKVGVRFDKAIPEGNNLGGLCEEDHGYLCSGDSLVNDILSFQMRFFYNLFVFCLIFPSFSCRIVFSEENSF